MINAIDRIWQFIVDRTSGWVEHNEFKPTFYLERIK
jgi:hypothetical protein